MNAHQKRFPGQPRAAFSAALACSLVLTGFPHRAHADEVIKNGNTAHDYFLEIEPHAALTPFWPPRGSAAVGGGGGVWFAFNVAPKGFLPQVNDSFALAVGADFLHYVGGPAVAGECVEWVGSGNERVCVRTSASGGVANYFYVPFVAQWNFYVVTEFSAFVELGIAGYFWSPRSTPHVGFGVVPAASMGGRYQFSDTVSLTFRLAYPYTTVGLSFRL